MIGILVFIYGLVFGSFFNVVGLRVPVKESIISPGSHCTNCQTSLSAKELIPVFSYCFQLGRCRHCKVSISPIYPFFELLTGSLYLIGYLLYGFTSTFILFVLLSSLLVIITISDLEYQMIPDKVLLFFLIAFLIFQVIYLPISWFDSVSGFLVSFGVLYIIAVVSNGGMGGGDIKLFAVLGVVLGWKGFIVCFILASLLGAVYGLSKRMISGEKNKALAFGPFIAIAAIISFVYEESIFTWYMNLFF